MPNLLIILIVTEIEKIRNFNWHINGINKTYFVTYKLNIIANYNPIINLKTTLNNPKIMQTLRVKPIPPRLRTFVTVHGQICNYIHITSK
jgi:hypothetical protein